jgi:hypothetical protein
MNVKAISNQLSSQQDENQWCCRVSLPGPRLTGTHKKGGEDETYKISEETNFKKTDNFPPGGKTTRCSSWRRDRQIICDDRWVVNRLRQYLLWQWSLQLLITLILPNYLLWKFFKIGVSCCRARRNTFTIGFDLAVQYSKECWNWEIRIRPLKFPPNFKP